MKIFLDDTRHSPDDTWTLVRTYDECMEILLGPNGDDVEVLSLDHDLGDTLYTGYDVLCDIERLVHMDPAYTPPRTILIHSANPVGKRRMEQALQSLRRTDAEKDMSCVNSCLFDVL